MILRALNKIKSTIYQKIDPIAYTRSIGVSVGERCVIESFNFSTEPYLITIGDHVEITTDVTFITHDGATWVMRDDSRFKDVLKFGKITIHDNVFIGHGAIILPGVEIGNNVIIAAGSVVSGSVPANSVYGGVPARFICTTEEYSEKCLENTPKWDLDSYRNNKKAEILRMLDQE